MRRVIAALALSLLLPVNAPAQGDPQITFDVRGWIRGSVDARVSAADDRQQQPVPTNAPEARGLLLVRARHTRARWFEATIAALVDGEASRSVPAGEDIEAWRGDARVDAREAFIGFFSRSVDARIGIQRIAWGHADAFQPNDVANANDIRHPVLNELELNHIPTFSARLDAETPVATVQVVAEPFFVGDRYDVYGTNWSLIQNGAPLGYRRLLNALDRLPGVSRDEAGSLLLIDAARPRGLSGAQGGLRIDWKPGAVDVSHYYHYGLHGTPLFHVDSSVMAVLAGTDWERVSQPVMNELLGAFTREGALTASWERRHHVGLDVGTVAGPFILRVDAAYQHPALFYDRAFNGWLSPAIEAVGGVEYQTGDINRVMLIEARYRRITRELPDGGLLFTNRNAADVAALIRRPVFAALEFELRAVAGLSPRSFVARPQLVWKRGPYALRGGVVVLGGEDHAFGGWYADNRSVYVMLRRDF